MAAYKARHCGSFVIHKLLERADGKVRVRIMWVCGLAMDKGGTVGNANAILSIRISWCE